jgi:Asp-tRNA(Asn)/Glu-tRNA(Gln) amidotransferase A subunit family amidase
MTEIAWASAVELARAVRQRRLSPVEIADALLARMEVVNPGINAYVHVRSRPRAPPRARPRGRGDARGRAGRAARRAVLDLDGEPLRRRILGWLLTYPFNMMASVPAASVPCGFSAAGLPVGLQLVARPRDDAGLLRAAASFERARPWSDRRPAL